MKPEYAKKVNHIYSLNYYSINQNSLKSVYLAICNFHIFAISAIFSYFSENQFAQNVIIQLMKSIGSAKWEVLVISTHSRLCVALFRNRGSYLI